VLLILAITILTFMSRRLILRAYGS
jgi:hypothetical protein